MAWPDPMTEEEHQVENVRRRLLGLPSIEQEEEYEQLRNQQHLEEQEEHHRMMRMQEHEERVSQFYSSRLVR